MSETVLVVVIMLLHLPGLVVFWVLLRALLRADRPDGPEPVRALGAGPLSPFDARSPEPWRWQRRGRRPQRPTGPRRVRTRARA